jgi:hypothetical protein
MRIPPEFAASLRRALTDALDSSDLRNQVHTFVPMDFRARTPVTPPTAMPDGTMVREFSDAGASLRPGALDRLHGIWKRGNPSETMPLGDLLDHPELYQNFPWMRRIKVGGVRGSGPLGQVMPGFLTPRGDRIGLNFYRPRTDAEHLSTLIHEVNHVVQHATELPMGGQPSVADQIYYGNKYEGWRRILGEQGAVQAQERQDMPIEELSANPPQFLPDYIDRGTQEYFPHFARNALLRNAPGKAHKLARNIVRAGATASLLRLAVQIALDEQSSEQRP